MSRRKRLVEPYGLKEIKGKVGIYLQKKLTGIRSRPFGLDRIVDFWFHKEHFFLYLKSIMPMKHSNIVSGSSIYQILNLRKSFFVWAISGELYKKLSPSWISVNIDWQWRRIEDQTISLCNRGLSNGNPLLWWKCRGYFHQKVWLKKYGSGLRMHSNNIKKYEVLFSGCWDS